MSTDVREQLDVSSSSLQSAAAATGNGTALDVKGYAAILLQVTGTFSAAVTCELTLDGTNWDAIEPMKVSDSSRPSTITTTGLYVVSVLGAERFRARVSSYTSGSVTVVGRGCTAAALAAMPDIQATFGGTVGTVDQGSPGATPWLVDLNKVAGTATAAGAGAVTAGTQRTTLASDDPAVASLGVMDDWDESDRAKVNPIVGQAGVAANTGVVSATTQRVTLATDVALPAGEAHIGELGGHMALIAASELTRPADTTAYAALDAVSDSTSAPTVRTFTNAARVAQGSGYVVGARVMTDQKTNVARFRLHLFHTTPTAVNDNAAQTLLYANKAKRIGSIDFSAMTTEDPTNSTAAESRNFDVRIPFTCDAADRNLYGLLETLDAFTPANAQKFYIELTIDQN